MSTLHIPSLALVCLVGSSSSGKSTFAARHFKSTEVLSSDRFRGFVSDDENDQAASAWAFKLLHQAIEARLAYGRLVVVDATNLEAFARRTLLNLARRYHCPSVAIVFDLPEEVIRTRNEQRGDRLLSAAVLSQHQQRLKHSIGQLKAEGFRRIYSLESVEEVESAIITREPAWSDRADLRGPFDIVGDVHGCYDELTTLLRQLGYGLALRDDKGGGGAAADKKPEFRVVSTPGRMLIFLGDLVDRGPRTPAVLRLAMDAVRDGFALCVPGNHDVKLVKALRGAAVKTTHGLAESLAQLAEESASFREAVVAFIDALPSHYVLDGRQLAVAHAGVKESMQGRSSRAVREFCLYGETTGEIDAFGLPVRYPWAVDYRGHASVVYGHTPVPEANWVNNTICIDTGCVFGGKLTCLRYPERELVSMPASQVHFEPVRPLAEPREPEAASRLLLLSDVTGKRSIDTRLSGRISIDPDRAAMALETLSCYGLAPSWLVYLPPLVMPPAPSVRPDVLEHPDEAFDYYRRSDVRELVCQEKHVGTRALALVCRDRSVAAAHFQAKDGRRGVVYNRFGRRFFDDVSREDALLKRMLGRLDEVSFWQEHACDWVLLDGVMLPESAQAHGAVRAELLRPTVDLAMADVSRLLEKARQQLPELDLLAARFARRAADEKLYLDACRRFAKTAQRADEWQFAPFAVMATHRKSYLGETHAWHMRQCELLSQSGDGFAATRWRWLSLDEPESVAQALAWWEELVASGGGGMMVKPMATLAQGPKGLLQPMLKVRSPDYLRLIHGPDYLEADNLSMLKKRAAAAKRALALRACALGVEGLERAVRRESLHKVHECVCAVVALSAEARDPRL